MNERYIFTASEDAKQIALNEISAADKSSKLVAWLDSGTGLMQSDLTFKELTELFKINPPIFIRHICPVYVDSDKLDGIKELLHLLDHEKTFSVQTRVLTKKGEKKHNINKYLSDYLESAGYELNVANPEQIASVVVTETRIYMGVSSKTENLSGWPGGMRRFARNEAMISRAEFKLLEALELFKINIETGGLALDLGAAPGGWTNVMLSLGQKVIAVDPATLSAKIIKDKNLTHYCYTAQKFFTEAVGEYDIILNDMKLDVKESTKIMTMAESFLKESGFGVITLKLPHKGWQKATRNALDYLNKYYCILGARQLFHNRSEVTVAVKKKYCIWNII